MTLLTILQIAAAFWPLYWWKGYRERKQAEAIREEAITAFKEATEAEKRVARTYKEVLAEVSEEQFKDDPR